MHHKKYPFTLKYHALKKIFKVAIINIFYVSNRSHDYLNVKVFLAAAAIF